MIDDGDDDYDCGAIGGMRTGSGNRSTRRKPAPVPLCPPKIPHDLTLARTRAAAVESYGTALKKELADRQISDVSDALGMNLQTMLLILYVNEINLLFTNTGLHSL
jgi:hypothetical protein